MRFTWFDLVLYILTIILVAELAFRLYESVVEAIGPAY